MRYLPWLERALTFGGVFTLAAGALRGDMLAFGIVGVVLVVLGRLAARRATPAEPRGVAHPYRDGQEPAPAEALGQWPRRIVAGVAIALALVFVPTLWSGGQPTRRHRWTFLEGESPTDLGLTARVAAAGDWSIAEHESATGGRLMVNAEGEEGAAPALLVAPALHARDVRVSTRCKTSSSCGTAFRFVDEKHYALARVDVVAKTVEIVRVEGEREKVLGRAAADVAPEIWQEITVEARGDRVVAYVNAREVLQAADVTASAGGTMGLWAPSLARAYFDELAVEMLVATPQAIEILPLLGRRPS